MGERSCELREKCLEWATEIQMDNLFSLNGVNIQRFCACFLEEEKIILDSAVQREELGGSVVTVFTVLR